MNLLQIFFIISGIIIFILSLDIAKKQKFNALHFLIFLGTGIGLLVFSFFPNFLNWIGGFFGLQRGADLLVYGSIIFLLYFVLLLLSKHVDNKDNITTLVRELAIENSEKIIIEGREVFVIRVYNEDTVLKDVIDSILDRGYKNILVINDGSNDSSRKILEDFKGKIVLLNHLKNRGAGATLETGFEYLRRFGRVDYIVSFDADGQHSIDDADKFFVEFERNKNVGVVFGSRFIEKTDSNVPFLRKRVLFLGRIFTVLTSGIYLTDSHNGYRAFRLDVIKKIRLTIDSMAYASELIDKLKMQGVKFKEVPVNIKYTKYSLSKGQSSRNAVSIAFRFIWNKFFR